MASRIPVHGDALPISRELVIALAVGFGLFNQALFAVLGAALVGEGNSEVGRRWIDVSLLIGALLLAVHVAFLLTARPRRWTDGLAAGVAASLAVWAGSRGFTFGAATALWPALGANAWMGAWWSRGWLRRGLARGRNRG